MTTALSLPVLYREVMLDAAEVRAAKEANADRIPMSLSSEFAVERGGFWDDPYMEVLAHTADAVDLSRAQGGLPLLLDHNSRQQIGVVEDVTLGADGKLRGFARFSRSDLAQEIKRDIEDGIRTRTSIGYRVLELTQESKATKQKAAVYRATKWALYENSIVSIPADPTVGVGRSAGEAALPVMVRSLDSATAPQGQETRMSATDTAAPTGAAPGAPIADRGAEIINLCALAGMSDRALDFVNSDKTIDAIKRELMDARKAALNAPAPVAPVKVDGLHNRAEDKPWGSFTEFGLAVKSAANGIVDPRLLASRGVATGMGIGQDSDGGFLVPEQYAAGIVTRAFDGGKLLSRVKRIPVSGNQYHMNLVDETSRATGSRWGGIRAYRIGENDTPTNSKPKFRRATLDVTKKLAVLAYVSEEQLQDATATDAILETAMTEEITFALEREIWEGNGGGECLGVMNSGAMVSVAAEGGQTAATIVTANVVKMNARLWSRSSADAVWFVQQQALEQLPLMTLANQPVYMPPSGLSGAGFGTLFGKPIEVVEYASALGTVGDITLMDLSQYALGEKPQSGIARSMHVRFVQGEEAFRLIYRADGLPMWNAPLTPFKGSNTVSPFITLAAR